jgi:hypothetical protein
VPVLPGDGRATVHVPRRSPHDPRPPR